MGSYKTIGAISGHFPRRPKTPKALTVAQAERIAEALTMAAVPALLVVAAVKRTQQ